jgi:type II secretory pathway pseudopilin PulG
MLNYSLAKNIGFTMVEIVVSILIFALSIAGLLSAISSLNRPAIESFEEVQAAYIGKQLFEELKQGIDASTWDLSNSILRPTASPITKTINRQGIDFTTSYTITNAIDIGGRWVDLTISWN